MTNTMAKAAQSLARDVTIRSSPKGSFPEKPQAKTRPELGGPYQHPEAGSKRFHARQFCLFHIQSRTLHPAGTILPAPKTTIA
jgi:hypothetical protein